MKLKKIGLIVLLTLIPIINIKGYYKTTKSAIVNVTTAPYVDLTISTDKDLYGNCNGTVTPRLTVTNSNTYDVYYSLSFSNNTPTYTIDDGTASTFITPHDGSKINAIQIDGVTGSSITITINVLKPYSTTYTKTINFDSICPTAALSSTTDTASSQTLTANISDDNGVTAYYYGTNSTPSDNDYTTIVSTLSDSFTNTISAAGTYYLFVKDAAGNVASTSATFRSMTLNATTNGGSVNPSTIVAKDGDSITLPDATIATDGYTFEKWSTTASGSGTDIASPYTFTSSSPATIYARFVCSLLYCAIKDSGKATKWTGAHADQPTTTGATSGGKDIYYFTANNANNAKAVLQKWNVYYGGFCWQAYRTTDTGGVKLLYNGLPLMDSNGEPINYGTAEAPQYYCGRSDSDDGTSYGYTSRVTTNNPGINASTTKNMSGTDIVYGTGYKYSKSTSKFTLTGTATYTVSDETSLADVVGKYTCMKTEAQTESDPTCATGSFWFVSSVSSGTTANVFTFTNNKPYATLGNYAFNTNYTSPADVGYMYGDRYTRVGSSSTNVKSENYAFSNLYTIDISSTKTTNNYWYADAAKYQRAANGSSNYCYNLDATANLQQSSDIIGDPGSTAIDATKIKNLVGKYTLKNTAASPSTCYTYVNYIVGYTISGTTYTIYSTSFNSGNFKNTIAGFDGNVVAVTDPETGEVTERYVPGYTAYFGTKLSAKDGDGNYTLLDAEDNESTLTETSYTWLTNHESRREMYTCGINGGVKCAQPKYITTSTTATYYRYYNTVTQNFYYGSSAYKNSSGKYVLTNPVQFFKAYDSANQASLNTHHYTCLEYTNNECTNLYFIYVSAPSDSYSYSSTLLYLNITNYKNYMTAVEDENDADEIAAKKIVITDVYAKMFSNTTNSTIKTAIDNWYRVYISGQDFESQLEDTVFCNDRSINWSSSQAYTETAVPNGYYMYFNYDQNRYICTNDTDKFSITNTNAQLTYKVGLATYWEIYKLTNNNSSTVYGYLAKVNNQTWWLGSPSVFDAREYSSGAKEHEIYNNGQSNNYYTNNLYGARPVVSLKSGTRYTSGTGALNNPYIVKIDTE